MYNYPFAYRVVQLRLEERLREAQDCLASQRRMMQHFAQALTWFGKRLIAWSERLQAQA